MSPTDHIVELQFIATNLPAAACTIFNAEKVNAAAGPKLTAFINKINSAENLGTHTKLSDF